MRSLLGGPAAAALTVTGNGTVSAFVPLPTLAPLQGYLFELQH
jgi:hypothetical protein